MRGNQAYMKEIELYELHYGCCEKKAIFKALFNVSINWQDYGHNIKEYEHLFSENDVFDYSFTKAFGFKYEDKEIIFVKGCRRNKKLISATTNLYAGAIIQLENKIILANLPKEYADKLKWPDDSYFHIWGETTISDRGLYFNLLYSFIWEKCQRVTPVERPHYLNGFAYSDAEVSDLKKYVINIAFMDEVEAAYKDYQELSEWD